jgi:hypothetical protein
MTMSHTAQIDQPNGPGANSATPPVSMSGPAATHAAQPATRINQIVALVAYAPEQVPAKREDSQQ